MENVTMNDILYVILTAVLPLLMTYLYQLVSVKVEDSKSADAISAVFKAVSYVNQTFVDSLKASGNFDAEAQKLAFNKAKDAALEIMSASTKAWLKKSYDNLDEWLTVQIEAAVKVSK